jgi:protein-tyrosine phosphatase
MKILMVCLGNICRSPLAEGIARHLISSRNLSWEVDSAGTIDWHQGNPPDRRSIESARRIGIDISNQRSRKINVQDLEDFDLILAMDAQNYQDVQKLNHHLAKDKLHLIMNFLYPGENRPVPDPYYGNQDDFDQINSMLMEACSAMLDQYQRR